MQQGRYGVATPRRSTGKQPEKGRGNVDLRPPGYLSKQELDSIFESQILPIYHSTPKRHPRVLVLIGQPGAGKSTVEPSLKSHLGYHDAVPVDADALYSYHPEYSTFACADENQALKWCGPASSYWSQRLINYAKNAKSDVILSSMWSSGDSERDAGGLTEWRRSNYLIEVVFIAVDDLRSKQAVIDRLLNARTSIGYGRPADYDVSRYWYNSILGFADVADRHADSVHVVKRGGVFLHSRDNDTRTGCRKPTRDVIKKERRRTWTEDEIATFIDTQYKLQEYYDKLQDGYLSALVQTEKQFVNYIRLQAVKKRHLTIEAPTASLNQSLGRTYAPHAATFQTSSASHNPAGQRADLPDQSSRTPQIPRHGNPSSHQRSRSFNGNGASLSERESQPSTHIDREFPHSQHLDVADLSTQLERSHIGRAIDRERTEMLDRQESSYPALPLRQDAASHYPTEIPQNNRRSSNSRNQEPRAGTRYAMDQERRMKRATLS